MVQCKTALILARVSSKEQEETGTSIPAQVERLTDYAKKHQLRILKAFELTESSTKDNRKKFEKLLKIAKEYPEPIAIVTETVDRLQRSFKESVELDALRKAGKVELHFYRENLVIHQNSNSSEIMRWDMAVMFAKMYVLQLSDNVKRSNEKKWSSGEWAGPAPIGYINITLESGRKDIILDQKRAPLVKKAFDMYASGNYTFRQLAKQMKADGLTTSKSDKFRTKGQMQEMIENPFYYGMMKVKGKLFKHRYPTIIQKWVYDKCKDIREGRNQNHVKYASKPFTFRGVLTCGGCQGTITLDTTTKKDGTIYRYCRCPNSKGNCPMRKSVRIEVFQEQIEKLLEGLTMPKPILEQVKAELKKTHKSQSDIHKNNLDRIHGELGKMKKRKDDAYLDKLDGRITAEQYDTFVRRFSADEQDLQEELAELTQADTRFLKSSMTVLELAQNASIIFHKASPDRKRQILNLLFSNLVMNGEKLDYELREPFDVLLTFSKNEEWLPGSGSNRRPIG